jgi:hypothetical protein
LGFFLEPKDINNTKTRSTQTIIKSTEILRLMDSSAPASQIGQSESECDSNKETISWALESLKPIIILSPITSAGTPSPEGLRRFFSEIYS